MYLHLDTARAGGHPVLQPGGDTSQQAGPQGDGGAAARVLALHHVHVHVHVVVVVVIVVVIVVVVIIVVIDGRDDVDDGVEQRHGE